MLPHLDGVNSSARCFRVGVAESRAVLLAQTSILCEVLPSLAAETVRPSFHAGVESTREGAAVLCAHLIGRLDGWDWPNAGGWLWCYATMDALNAEQAHREEFPQASARRCAQSGNALERNTSSRNQAEPPLLPSLPHIPLTEGLM